MVAAPGATPGPAARSLAGGIVSARRLPVFEIHEPKRRIIAAAPFADRVVHHALCNLLAPVLERRFIARSFSCQLGKGTTAARECCRQLTNRHRYVLKCDVRKFFPNLDHEILFATLAEQVREAGAQELVRKILGSYRTGAEVPPPLFPGEDLLVATERPPRAPNWLAKVPAPARPDQVWVVDITYIATLEGWIYLAVILDACGRRIVGRATGTSLETTLVTQALERAHRQRRPAPGLVPHSDRGVQYASGAWRGAAGRLRHGAQHEPGGQSV